MKRLLSITVTLILVCLIPSSFIRAQEIKNEKKIKIIVSDGSGTKVIIDTLIKDDDGKDPVILRDGKLIVASSAGVEIVKSGDDNEHVFINITSDDKNSVKTEKEVTVISGDSMTWTEGGDKGTVYVFKGSDSKGSSHDGQYRVVTSSSGNDDKEKTIVYVDADRDSKKVIEKKYNVSVSTDRKGEKAEKSTYMIAKDGIVISIEGNDDSKTKDLVKDIEKLMGIDEKDNSKKETVKEETKKVVRK